MTIIVALAINENNVCIAYLITKYRLPRAYSRDATEKGYLRTKLIPAELKYIRQFKATAVVILCGMPAMTSLITKSHFLVICIAKVPFPPPPDLSLPICSACFIRLVGVCA